MGFMDFMPGTGPLNLMQGKGSVAKALGLEKEQGMYFTPKTANEELEAYVKGINSDFMDPIKGTQIATEQVQNNPLLASLFGKEGLQSRLGSEEQRLASQGFSLTNDDHEAYGQASGNIARMFGQADNDMTANLAKRGLASAPSGAAGVGFSGIQGNKMEQLAAAQTQIANQRMQNTQARLNSTRSMMQGLGQDAAQNIGNQYIRQNERTYALGDAADKRETNNTNYNTGQMASLSDMRANQGKSLLEGFGQGLFSSAQQIGGAPGQATNNFVGGGSSSISNNKGQQLTQGKSAAAPTGGGV